MKHAVWLLGDTILLFLHQKHTVDLLTDIFAISQKMQHTTGADRRSTDAKRHLNDT